MTGPAAEPVGGLVAKPGDPSPTLPRGGRNPLLPAAFAAAAGIVADRFLGIPVGVWFLAASVGVIVALAVWRRSRISALAVLVVLASVGALRHHQCWTSRPANDISRVELQDDSPVRLVGVVESPVEVRDGDASPQTPAWMKGDRSSFDLSVERLKGIHDLPVTGLVRVDVTGHLIGLGIGDRVEVLGHIRIPGPPREPGGFDLQAWLKSRGIDRAMNVEHPDAISRMGDASTLAHRAARFRHSLRTDCEQLLAGVLSPGVRAVGTSLLLGTRTGITDEVREAFINSGTMHLLAISGLHVGILATLTFAACRLGGLSTGATVLTVLAALLSYTVLTDLRPPVLRSALLGCLVVAAVPAARVMSGLNLLAGTALAMLLWNPLDLFDLGAQLSFLAVGAILWSARAARIWSRPTDDGLLDSDLTPFQRHWRGLRRKAAEGYFVTAAIWLFTLPLTLAWFQLFSPVGFLINVVLVPFSVPLLATGFLTLAVGLVLPWLAWLPGLLYDACLRLLMLVVNAAAGTPWGHLNVAGPGVWQLCLFYTLLALAVMLPVRLWQNRAWATLALSVVVMLAWSLRPKSSDNLVVTFLDVGHGGAVLFEFPGGETALFDAGSFGRGDAAEQTIHRALQARRIAALNALVLSHADSDHYNAAAGLIQKMPIGSVYISQAFPDPAQWSVAEVCETAARCGVPLRLIQAGDSFSLSRNCALEVLHPSGRFRDKLDNAHSIVLRATFAGRRVLVTGDVEKGGVRALMEAHPAQSIDVFQAPHHGGKLSNTSDLARWARPTWVIACNRNDDVVPRLREVYADAERIFTSASNGTVTATITRSGDVHVVASRSEGP